MRISYILTSFGTYKLRLETKKFNTFISENITGFASDAKSEIAIISNWSLPEVWNLHTWARA